jgi:hypothetical protein
LSIPDEQNPVWTVYPNALLVKAWLEFHRTTLLLKAEGVEDLAREHRTVASSILSLHSLVGHMAEVERSWFWRVLQRESDTPYIWYDPNVEDSDRAPLDGADWVEDLAIWQTECEETERQPRPAPWTTPA